MAKLIQKGSKILLAFAICLGVMLAVFSYATKPAANALVDDWTKYTSWDTEVSNNHPSHSLVGAGTLAEPLKISSPIDLAFLSTKVAKDESLNTTKYSDLHYIFTSNIDMAGKLFTPITKIGGAINGDGYVIKNLFINDNAGTNTGLVSRLNSAGVIKNLGIVGGKIHNTDTLGSNIGAFVGINEGEITNVFNTAEVKKTIAVTSSVGGLVGINNGKISHSFNAGSVEINGAALNSAAIGGIAGESAKSSVASADSHLLSNCYNIGSVINSCAASPTVTVAIGGVVGNVGNVTDNTLLFSYFNKENVTPKALKAIGGVANDCAPTEIVSTTGGNQFKGINANGFTAAISDLGLNISVWNRGASAIDISAYYAPSLKVFATNNASVIKLATRIQLYGENFPESIYEWGTANNPYAINSCEQYIHLANAVNNGITYTDKAFVLNGDLDFSGKTEMSTIGTGERRFNGVFDGGNFTINNLVIDRHLLGDINGNYVGMFGSIGDRAVVENFTIADTCEFNGIKNIGSVAGISYGAIKNVASYAKVKGDTNVGGIAGESSTATFTNILSSVILSGNSETAKAYGIVGAASGFTGKNVWYITKYNAKFNSAGDYGSLLIIDKNGNITAKKEHDGSIIFNRDADGSSLILEYRNANEGVVCATEKYEPDVTAVATAIVYARFVKSIEFTQLSVDKGVVTGSGNYYEGQDITFTVKTNDGYFVKSISGIFNDGTTTSQSDIEAKFTYATGSNNVVVKMVANLTKIQTEVDAIGAPPIAPRDYDGAATAYTFEKTGFDAEITYSVGFAPKNAGNYKMTVTLKKNGVYRGKNTQEFTINKRQLTFIDAVQNISKIKEYDNILTPATAVAKVKQDGINFVAGDDIRVTATSAFSETAIGTGRTAIFYFDVDGTDKINYLAPNQISVSDCEITKRTLTYEIKNNADLSRIYDGNTVAIPNFGTIESNIIISGKNPFPRFWFSTTAEPNKRINEAINAGEYLLHIEGGVPPTGLEAQDGRDYYILTLKENYVFTVKPRPVAVTITDFSGFVYNKTAFTVGGWFLNEKDQKIVIAPAASNFVYERLINNVYTPDHLHTNAGNYRVTAALSGNYTPDTTLTNSDKHINQTLFTITKANQPTINFGAIVGAVTYGDADITLTYTGGVTDEASDVFFSVVSGFGRIIGANKDILQLIGGGQVVLTVTKAETENYFAITSAQYPITVAKATLKISLPDFSCDYGTLLNNIAFNFDGFVASDTSLTEPSGFVAPSITIDGAPLDITKLYDAKAAAYKLAVAQNAISDGYDFDYSYFVGKDVNLQVNQKAITITLDNKQITYGDKDIPLTYTIAEGEFTLVGELVREQGQNAATYKITRGTLTDEANSNFKLTIVDGAYVILQKELTITAIAKQKNFNEKDPSPDYSVTGLVNGEKINDIVTGSLLRAAGENAFNAGSANEYGYYQYLSSGFTIQSNYVLKFVPAVLKIFPIKPVFDPQKDMFIQYGDVLKVIKPTVTVGGDIQGSFHWVTPDVVPDFTNSPTLKFDAVFTPSSKNYKETTLELEVKVNPRELTITFDGATDLKYNGLPQKNITYIINNAVSGDDLKAELTYDGDVKEVGIYKASVTIANSNYKIVGDNFVTITIAKVDLLIYLADINLPEGTVPPKDFIYEGFVNGETADVLTKLPDVTFYTAVGNYTIKPVGATAANYNISYKESNQLVTKTKLANELQNLKLTGNFNYLMEMQFKEIKSAENKAKYTALAELFQTIKTAELSTTKLARLYSIGFTINGEKAHLTSTARATMEVPTRLREARVIQVVLVKEDGTMVYAKNVQREGNVLSFDIEDCESFGIVSPPDYTYIIVAVVIFVLIIAVFALDMVSEKLGLGRHSEKHKAQKLAKKMAKKNKKS